MKTAAIVKDTGERIFVDTALRIATPDGTLYRTADRTGAYFDRDIELLSDSGYRSFIERWLPDGKADYRLSDSIALRMCLDCEADTDTIGRISSRYGSERQAWVGALARLDARLFAEALSESLRIGYLNEHKPKQH